MSEKKYSTGELEGWLREASRLIKEMNTKLWAADKLCEAVQTICQGDGVIFCESDPHLKKLRIALKVFKRKP